MRRTIPLRLEPKIKVPAHLKKHQLPPEIRLFIMTDRQAELFHQVVVALARAGETTWEAASYVVERTVTTMLCGQMPPEGAPTVFHHLRVAFPVLSQAQIDKLPKFGCPRGEVKAVILTLGIDEGEAAGTHRIVRFDMSPHQAATFNATISTIQKRNGCDRDEAWHMAAKVLGRLIGGAETKEGAEPVMVRMAEAFAGLTNEEALDLPLATEDDIRQLQFREVTP